MSGVMGRNIALALMAATAGIAGLAVATPGAASMQQELRSTHDSAKQQPARTTKSAALGSTFAQAFGGFGFGSRGSSRRRGPGWTQAHVKRMARKARNVARNRRAHR